jgi:hypothetical protein
MCTELGSWIELQPGRCQRGRPPASSRYGQSRQAGTGDNRGRRRYHTRDGIPAATLPGTVPDPECRYRWHPRPALTTLAPGAPRSRCICGGGVPPLHKAPSPLVSITSPRYTPTSTFETFPFPADPAAEAVREVEAAAEHLNVLRVGWQDPPGASPVNLAKRTLTGLYNSPPTWLAQAHERLDRAVHAAYGWPFPLSDDELLARLLEINLARSAPPDVQL